MRLLCVINFLITKRIHGPLPKDLIMTFLIKTLRVDSSHQIHTKEIMSAISYTMQFHHRLIKKFFRWHIILLSK
jgi:hypothetical protein